VVSIFINSQGSKELPFTAECQPGRPYRLSHSINAKIFQDICCDVPDRRDIDEWISIIRQLCRYAIRDYSPALDISLSYMLVVSFGRAVYIEAGVQGLRAEVREI